jgi:hypothetical protein
VDGRVLICVIVQTAEDDYIHPPFSSSFIHAHGIHRQQLILRYTGKELGKKKG